MGDEASYLEDFYIEDYFDDYLDDESEEVWQEKKQYIY